MYLMIGRRGWAAIFRESGLFQGGVASAAVGSGGGIKLRGFEERAKAGGRV